MEEENYGGGRRGGISSISAEKSLKKPVPLFLLSLEQRGPLCLRTNQAIKISSKPFYLESLISPGFGEMQPPGKPQGLTLDFLQGPILSVCGLRAPVPMREVRVPARLGGWKACPQCG